MPQRELDSSVLLATRCCPVIDKRLVRTKALGLNEDGLDTLTAQKISHAVSPAPGEIHIVSPRSCAVGMSRGYDECLVEFLEDLADRGKDREETASDVSTVGLEGDVPRHYQKELVALTPDLDAGVQ